MTLPHVAFEMATLIISARTENVWAFERVLHLVTKFVCDKLNFITEFFAANAAF